MRAPMSGLAAILKTGCAARQIDIVACIGHAAFGAGSSRFAGYSARPAKLLEWRRSTGHVCSYQWKHTDGQVTEKEDEFQGWQEAGSQGAGAAQAPTDTR